MLELVHAEEIDCDMEGSISIFDRRPRSKWRRFTPPIVQAQVMHSA
jgi:hypothetical protein